MALLGSPMTRPAPRTPQTPPPSMIDPSGSLYGGAGALPNHGMPMPGQRVMNAAYAPAASNPAAAVHAAMSRFAPSQPSLSHFLAAAAAAHPRRVGPEQPANAYLPPQAGNFAQLEPILRAILGGQGVAVGNPNLRYGIPNTRYQ